MEDDTHFQAAGAIEVVQLVAALHNQGVLPSGSLRRLTAQIPASTIV